MAVLEASLDTRDSGRGMNSSVSEKPTRARGIALEALGVVVSPRLGDLSGVRVAWGFCVSETGVKGIGGMSGSLTARLPSCLLPKSAGLVGALLPRKSLVDFGGCRISDRSWLEMAADLRCR